MDDRTATDALMKSLDSLRDADQFFSDTAKYFKNAPPTQCDMNKFKTHLSSANRITGGKDLDFVCSVLRRDGQFELPGDIYDIIGYIPLGFFDDFQLAVQIDIGALVPQGADSATIESCNVTSLTSNRTIGARYDYLGPGNWKESMIFAQFGRIFCMSRHGQLLWLEEDDDCHDTGFVLALELQSSGLADEFYIICNLTRDDGCKEMSAEEIYDHPDLLQFCNTKERFTVARVESQGFDLLRGSWEEIEDLARQDKKIQLTKLSDRIPEIVETGWRQDSNGDKSLVGLFPS